MLVELRVQDLGVIADLDLVIGPGMTALTGETGAGKTLVVEALELLVGGRADAARAPRRRRGGRRGAVRHRRGRGRAVAGRAGHRALAGLCRRAHGTGVALAEIGAGLVDLHGQHAHQ